MRMSDLNRWLPSDASLMRRWLERSRYRRWGSVRLRPARDLTQGPAAPKRCINTVSLVCLVAVLSVPQLSVAQSGGQDSAPVIVTPPAVEAADENFVSIFSGKPHFSLPVLKMGDVSFVPYSYNSKFAKSGVVDRNYGWIDQCLGLLPAASGFSGHFPCSVAVTQSSHTGIQTVHGEDRATFVFTGSSYYSYTGDGATFVDNGDTCTWTKRDGTKVVYYAFHDGNNPSCKSNNIKEIIYPDGRIATYHHYGSFSTAPYAWSPILSITTNSGYMLKYNYSGTPNFGSQTSVTAINRAFETCNPTSQSCSLTHQWPTATLTFQDKTVSPSDNFPPLGSGYLGTRHYMFTIEEPSKRKHVFELDSYFRVISYQPPGATAPKYHYNLCSLLVGDALRNCFGITQWVHYGPEGFDLPPLLFDLVESVSRGGQTWNYYAQYAQATLPYPSTWARDMYDPRGVMRSASGVSTPGVETIYGGSNKILTQADGTVIEFEYSRANPPRTVTTPEGIKTTYTYDSRGNLTLVVRQPVPDSSVSVITQSADYPSTCTNLKICNKPTAVVDGNGNQTDYTYDSTHGGTLTVTRPAVTVGRPETRYTYVPRKAWYRDNSGTMAEDPGPIWVLESESECVQGGACSVVTTYEYGPTDAGPNNLLVRGKAITADGVTRRICYGHDRYGNVIWETAPKANPLSCTAY